MPLQSLVAVNASIVGPALAEGLAERLELLRPTRACGSCAPFDDPLPELRRVDFPPEGTMSTESHQLQHSPSADRLLAFR